MLSNGKDHHWPLGNGQTSNSDYHLSDSFLEGEVTHDWSVQFNLAEENSGASTSQDHQTVDYHQATDIDECTWQHHMPTITAAASYPDQFDATPDTTYQGSASNGLVVQEPGDAGTPASSSRIASHQLNTPAPLRRLAPDRTLTPASMQAMVTSDPCLDCNISAPNLCDFHIKALVSSSALFVQSRPPQIKLYDAQFQEILRLFKRMSWFPESSQAEEPLVECDDPFVLGKHTTTQAKSRFEAFVYRSGDKYYCRINHITKVDKESGPCRFKAKAPKDVIAHACKYLKYEPYVCATEDCKCGKKFATRERRNDHHSKVKRAKKNTVGTNNKINCDVCSTSLCKRNEERHFRNLHPDLVHSRFPSSGASIRRSVTRLQLDPQP